jgi:hypothetical protein
MQSEGLLPYSQEPTTRHFWASWIQFTPSHPVYLRFILTLPSHLRLGLPSSYFHWCFPTNISYVFLIFSMRATCLTCLILQFRTVLFLHHVRCSYKSVPDVSLQVWTRTKHTDSVAVESEGPTPHWASSVPLVLPSGHKILYTFLISPLWLILGRCKDAF